MTKYWHPKNIKQINDSPGREYLNEFLYKNLPNFLSAKEIRILDIGCGSGYIRKIFYDLGYKLFYDGLDVKKHKDFDKFNKYAVESNFIHSEIENFNTEKKYNIILSICALEHIENDITVFPKTCGFLEKNGIQIHIVPSYWSLFLYLRHGYRRYGPVRLKKMFKTDYIYRLGGLFSFFLHFFFITIPERIFGSRKPFQSKTYLKLLNIANKLDPLFPVFSSIYVAISKNQND